MKIYFQRYFLGLIIMLIINIIGDLIGVIWFFNLAAKPVFNLALNIIIFWSIFYLFFERFEVYRCLSFAPFLFLWLVFLWSVCIVAFFIFFSLKSSGLYLLPASWYNIIKIIFTISHYGIIATLITIMEDEKKESNA